LVRFADVGHSGPTTLPQTKRELLVWIWYPAAEESQGTSDYLPVELRAAVEHRLGSLISKFLTRDLARVRAHSIPNASISSQQSSYPVVIMRGGASSPLWNYSTLAEDLASHGFVVVGFDSPYRTEVVVLRNGHVITRTQQNNPETCLHMSHSEQERCVSRVMSAWTSDMSFAVDRLASLNTDDPSGIFTGRLDLSRIGVFGHSLGGAEAAQFCHEDSRCKAGMDIDGALHGDVIGIDRPFMFLLSDHSGESDPQAGQIGADIQSVYDRLPANGRAFMEIRGANHFLFSDDGALLKSHILLRILRALGIVRIDGRRQLAVTAYCLRSFFDAFLKNGSESRLAISSPLYPELQSLK
jgi:predicted dienelactone hydrolase